MHRRYGRVLGGRRGKCRGAACAQGLLDLDRPIRDYGVQPNADWAATGPDFFPHVTVRTLLAQSSGYGVVMPGTRMTYDSDVCPLPLCRGAGPDPDARFYCEGLTHTETQ